MADQPSQAVQDYLKAIHRLGGADRGRVARPRSPTRLGVQAPSVTGMLKRLAEAGWIEYTPGDRGAAHRRRASPRPAGSSAGTGWSSCS